MLMAFPLILCYGAGDFFAVIFLQTDFAIGEGEFIKFCMKSPSTMLDIKFRLVISHRAGAGSSWGILVLATVQVRSLLSHIQIIAPRPCSWPCLGGLIALKQAPSNLGTQYSTTSGRNSLPLPRNTPQSVNESLNLFLNFQRAQKVHLLHRYSSPRRSQHE